MAASDKLAAAELTIAKDQLKSLHGTVMRINQERAEVSPYSLNAFVSSISKTQPHTLWLFGTDFGHLQTTVVLSAFLKTQGLYPIIGVAPGPRLYRVLKETTK